MRGARIALFALLVVAPACRQSDAARAAAARPRRVRTDIAEATYRVVPVADGGSVQGRLIAPDRLPTDSTVRPHNAEGVCGPSVVLPAPESARGGLGGAIVWLDTVRQGKPLPTSRRFELVNRRCEFEPRVQTAIVGGMLNVRNTDRLTHRTRFLLAGSDSVVELVRQSDAGQVVPVAQVLAHPARIEVRSDVYPWMRAWIQVFDHPYYAVTGRDGSFALDSIPPGRYRLYAWHETVGVRQQDVTVGARERQRIEIEF